MTSYTLMYPIPPQTHPQTPVLKLDQQLHGAIDLRDTRSDHLRGHHLSLGFRV